MQKIVTNGVVEIWKKEKKKGEGGGIKDAGERTTRNKSELRYTSELGVNEESGADSSERKRSEKKKERWKARVGAYEHCERDGKEMERERDPTKAVRLFWFAS